MSQLPTGEVTFFFTDIEGSTQRWDRDRAAMQAAVRRHDAILRSAIEAHRGVVFKTIGDAFCAAFSRASDGVAAAVTAQRALGAEDFSGVEGLRVRIALHSGTADERDDDYFGPTVNRVARLLAICHGGQILLSQICAERTRAGLDAGTELVAMGRHQLKDLADPESVFQLVATGLPSEFPPLRSLGHLRENLPRELNSFVARGSELREIGERVRAHRLVTLVGAGGVGKTRLALHVGAELLDDFPDGVWFVQFAPITEPHLVIGAIAAVVGLHESLNRPMAETLLTHLRNKRLLFVFDNCEHLIAQVATAADDILRACPDVRILATTREALSLPGEVRYAVPELAVPEASPAPLGASGALEFGAIVLFAQRAREADARFEVSDANAETIAEICRRLDGVPLAIELAAARVRTLPVDVLARHLDERFRLLTSHNRLADPRQRTLNALIDWSYNLLSEDERRFFAELSPFVGGASLEMLLAAQGENASDEWSLLERVTSLLDKSLLKVKGDGDRRRYRYLESIRAYARERLRASGAEDEVLRRYAGALADFADGVYADFDEGVPPGWLERCEDELDNVRAALAWALERGKERALAARIAGGFGVAFLRTTRLREGTDWCVRVLDGQEQLAPALVARVQYVLSMLNNNQARYAEALTAAQCAVDAYREAGDERGRILALSQVATQMVNNARADEALMPGEEAVRLARSLGDRTVLAGVLARCANVYGAADFEKARAYYAESAELWRRLGRDAERARALWWWAQKESASGSYEATVRILDDLLPVAAGDLRLWVMSAACSVYWSLADRERAIPATREALALAVQAEHPILIADALSYAAMIAFESDPREAARFIGFASQRQRELEWSAPDRERVVHDAFARQVRARLGEPAFESAFREGAAWSEREASARAAHV